MKRKYRWVYFGVAGCITIVSVLFIVIKAKSKNSVYEKYECAEEFYGEKLYSEIDHKSTSEEEVIGKQIANKQKSFCHIWEIQKMPKKQEN